MKPGWDDHAFEVAKTMYHDGMSYGDIARVLSREGYTLTRNAVLGKLNRTGVANGSTMIKRNDGRPKQPKVPKAPMTIEFIKPSKPLPAMK